VPSAHSYIAHAGLLASNPTLPPSHPQQPLAHAPRLPPSPASGAALAGRMRLLRRLQEEALLNDVPQNKDPWVVLNMRGVRRDHSITDGKSGIPWADVWNADMARCSGYENSSTNNGNEFFPCLPSMVVYGHAASRGLDIHRWSIGLDSGCVYGRRLTALVLGEKIHEVNGGSQDDIDAPQSPFVVPYGDKDSAYIVSINCHAD